MYVISFLFYFFLTILGCWGNFIKLGHQNKRLHCLFCHRNSLLTSGKTSLPSSNLFPCLSSLLFPLSSTSFSPLFFTEMHGQEEGEVTEVERELRGAGRDQVALWILVLRLCWEGILMCKCPVPCLTGNSFALGAQEGTVSLRSVLYLW